MLNATVTGARENRQGDKLEIPCIYKFKGSKTFLLKAECIIEILLVEGKQIDKNTIASFFSRL